MPEYLAPGVFIEEFEIGAKPIEGVSTSTAAFLGETERGPTYPQLVTSFPEYRRIFGEFFDENKFMPVSVDGFFANGGQRCYVTRIVDTAAAVSARCPLPSRQSDDFKKADYFRTLLSDWQAELDRMGSAANRRSWFAFLP